jgi:hypothetical protein
MSDRTNRAVDRLAEALHELGYRGRLSITPDVRLLLCPGQPKPEDARHLHAVGLSAELVELLAETVEQLLITIDTAGEPVDPRAAEAFARNNPELADDVASAFTDIDVDALARTVLDDDAPRDRAAINRALDAMFRPTQDETQEDGDDA